MPDDVRVYRVGDRLVEFVTEGDEVRVQRVSFRRGWELLTYERIFDLPCAGEVFVAISPSGVAHRSPFVMRRTLCGIDYPSSWTPASGVVTCLRCWAAAAPAR